MTCSSGGFSCLAGLGQQKSSMKYVCVLASVCLKNKINSHECL